MRIDEFLKPIEHPNWTLNIYCGAGHFWKHKFLQITNKHERIKIFSYIESELLYQESQ